jgi:rfaE bifunctional protein nucleotidyltransferase chain/domain
MLKFKVMGHLNDLVSKVCRRDDLSAKIRKFRDAGQRIVFTNGCFDILHKGHVLYLASAAEKGDKLVLGLNSDDSVKRQGKGDDRPVNDLEARATVLAALSFVDLIVEFDEDTPLGLIEEIVPDVLVKGGDYDPKESNPASKIYMVGREVVLNNGGEVLTIPTIEGFSTTGIIKKLKK